jgi:hypothetical protein
VVLVMAGYPTGCPDCGRPAGEHNAAGLCPHRRLARATDPESREWWAKVDRAAADAPRFPGDGGRTQVRREAGQEVAHHFRRKAFDTRSRALERQMMGDVKGEAALLHGARMFEQVAREVLELLGAE